MEKDQQALTKKGAPLTDFTLRLSSQEATKQGKRWNVLQSAKRLQIIDLLNRYDTLYA